MGGTPKIFCIDLPARSARRERIERRFARHGLLERTAFVEAVTVSAPRAPTPEWKDAAGRACFASHLKAMRALLADPECAVRGALICENDILLHNRFAELLGAVLANLPPGARHCSLGYLVSRWDREFVWAGRDAGRENLCRMVPGALWASHCYWIEPAYARATLDRYGTLPTDELPSMTERIAHEAEGYVSYPALAIQDAIDSTIRPPEEMDFHIWGQAPWDYADYAACERGEELSPLAAEPSSQRTIGLCMIVRDEVEVIGRCVASALPLIDSWTICDTGSVDGTPELVTELLANVPGELHHRPWRDFGGNRSELMRLARGSADYLLLLDADMTVERRGPRPPLDADAYALRHAGSLGYSILRLVRGDRRWWYEGSTHEHLATEGEFSRESLEALLVHHHADSGTRDEKLARDARLLERDLERDPANQRATFYLAQTYRDAGETGRAIELYERRVELGGWDEEVFYAAYQAGVLTGHDDPEAAVAPLLDALERRPSRAEPLHELARLSRLRGDHEAAYRYASRGLELPMPDDILFVHRDVYEWGLAFELSIAAYWTGEHAEALELSERLLDEGRLPGDVERAVRQNRSYCLAALGRDQRRLPGTTRMLADLVPALELGEIRLDTDPPWPAFNPTIAADGDGFRAIVRTANYRLRGGRYEFLEGDEVIRTLNYLVRLDRSLALEDAEPLADLSAGPRRHPSPVEGYEDCRLVRVGKRWYASATVRDRNPGATCEIALLGLDGARIETVRVLPGPEPGRHEKNWMPFAAGGRLRFVYSLAPTVILGCDPNDGAVERAAEHPAPAWAESLRGGSQAVAVDGGLLFVVHQALNADGGRSYNHRFALLDGDCRLVAASPPFSIAGEPIELCAGMAARGDELILSFGAGDRAAGLAVLPRDEVLGLLEPPA